jgi:hypothetical protein
MIMISLIQWSGAGDSSDTVIGFIGVGALGCFILWAFLRWLADSPVHPDPWDEKVAAEIESDDAPMLCQHCLEPHPELVNFCPACGAPVGTYTNYLPFPYLFSIGYVLRTGTEGGFRRSPLSIAGFLLLGVAEYSVLAPLYWFMVLRRLVRGREPDPPMPPAAANGVAGSGS